MSAEEDNIENNSHIAPDMKSLSISQKELLEASFFADILLSDPEESFNNEENQSMKTLSPSQAAPEEITVAETIYALCSQEQHITT